MKWARIQQGEAPAYGIVEDDRIALVDGTPFGEHRRSGRTVPVKGTRFLPPVVPPTFYAQGVNYRAHFRTHAKPGAMPTQSHIGYRAVNALIGHEEAIVVPKDSAGKLQFEGELVAVIGRRARNLSEAEALSCVLGYTLGNDISEREWQKSDRTLWRAKNCDTFKPMGPWIETDVKLEDLQTIVRLNGKEVSRFPTNDLIFGVAHTISAISRYITLVPGDVVWMGTDDPTLDMVAGDVVEVEIPGIGVLRNPLVAET